jgi:hypothetical protein
MSTEVRRDWGRLPDLQVDEETGRSDVRVARQTVPGVSPSQGLRGVPVRQAVD